MSDRSSVAAINHRCHGLPVIAPHAAEIRTPTRTSTQDEPKSLMVRHSVMGSIPITRSRAKPASTFSVRDRALRLIQGCWPIRAVADLLSITELHQSPPRARSTAQK